LILEAAFVLTPVKYNKYNGTRKEGKDGITARGVLSFPPGLGKTDKSPENPSSTKHSLY